MSEEKSPPKQSHLKKALLSGVSAFQSTMLSLLIHPLEVIRSRLQSHDGGDAKKNVVPKYKGTIHAFKTIYRAEGVRGLYKGVAYAYLTNNLYMTNLFALYGAFKSYFSTIYGERNSKTFMLSSLCSGQLGIAIFHPLMVVRTRMYLNTDQKISGFQNFTKNFWKIQQEHGIRGFYRGLTLSGVIALSSMINLTIYEEVKLLLQKYLKESKFLGVISGMTGRFVASLIFYPFSTMRLRIQQQQKASEGEPEKYRRVRDVIIKTIRQEGIFGFYKGVLPYWLKVLPSSAFFFFFYEMFMKFNQRFVEHKPENKPIPRL